MTSDTQREAALEVRETPVDEEEAIQRVTGVAIAQRLAAAKHPDTVEDFTVRFCSLTKSVFHSHPVYDFLSKSVEFQ